MTSKDKTGDRLVASIRKSKTGSVAGKTAASAAQDKPAAVKPQADAAPPAPPGSAARKRRQEGASSQDNYRVGKRVWPD